MRIIFLNLLLLVLSAHVVAQDAQQCSKLLSFGIYDKYQTMSYESQYQLIKKFFKSNEFSSSQAASSKAAQLGIDIEDVLKLNFNGNTASSNFQQWKQDLERSTYDEALRLGLKIQVVETISGKMTDLIKTCLTLQGLHAYIIPALDNRSFSVTADFVPPGSDHPSTKGTLTITPPSVAASCRPNANLDHEVTIGPQGVSISCMRLPSETVTIQINAGDGTRVITYDAFVIPSVVATLNADPPSIQSGQSSKLSWEVTNASRVELVGYGEVTASGTMTVTPRRTTQYQLKVTSLNGEVKSVFTSVDVAPPPPVLTQAKVSFHTTNEDKDADTHITVSIICAGNTVATVANTWGKWGDNSDSGWKDMRVTQAQKKSEVPGVCVAQIVEGPVGKDEWHFNTAVELKFSDGTIIRKDWPGGNVDYDRTTLRYGF